MPGTILVCGDATTVGLWDSMIRWLPIQTRVSGVVEVPPQDVPLAQDLLPGVEIVAQTTRPGEAVLSWLDQAPPGDVVSTQPYWATGKVGL